MCLCLHSTHSPPPPRYPRGEGAATASARMPPALAILDFGAMRPSAPVFYATGTLLWGIPHSI